ncbi:MAG TPA: Ldh family oxidoreductase [Methylomirabilota bacterium]|nr:Ldh family oxidoreductase [Methylomirabilota bacterium]
MADPKTPVLCAPDPLREFVTAVARRMGADADVAAELARHLVGSNLAGHDSHGVIRVPQYVGDADQGLIVPSARPVLSREGAVAALVDARRGFGQHSTMFALEWAMARARQHGVAMVAVRHSTHIGRLGEYAERAAGAGLIGLVTVGAIGAGIGGVVPFGGRTRFLGTNPWALSMPGRRRHFVFDAATSTLAEGKVRVARAAGKPLPPDAIVDPGGLPSRDAEAFYAGGALLPLGGALAGHKGYGLGLASALLGALGMIGDPEPTLVGAAPPETADTRGRIAGVFLEVVDPAAFGDPAAYVQLVDEALDAAKRQSPAAGVAEVLVPGEPEERARVRRSRDGVPLSAATWAELGTVATRFGVSLPPSRPGA